jgi:hypothetical protein
MLLSSSEMSEISLELLLQNLTKLKDLLENCIVVKNVPLIGEKERRKVLLLYAEEYTKDEYDASVKSERIGKFLDFYYDKVYPDWWFEEKAKNYNQQLSKIMKNLGRDFVPVEFEPYKIYEWQ